LVNLTNKAIRIIFIFQDNGVRIHFYFSDSRNSKRVKYCRTRKTRY